MSRMPAVFQNLRLPVIGSARSMVTPPVTLSSETTLPEDSLRRTPPAAVRAFTLPRTRVRSRSPLFVSKVTLGEVTARLLADLRGQGRADAYVRSLTYGARLMVKELGEATLITSLSKGVLIPFIRAGAAYWDRFGRKRIASLVVSKAIEMEVIAKNPLDGFVFETATSVTSSGARPAARAAASMRSRIARRFRRISSSRGM